MSAEIASESAIQPSSSPMYDQTIVATLLGGLQGSISVLLTALAGYLAASYGLLDRRTVTIISKLSAKVFLPALMINSMGPHLTSDRIEEFWIMPVWGFVSSVFGHFLGWLGTVRVPFVLSSFPSH